MAYLNLGRPRRCCWRRRRVCEGVVIRLIQPQFLHDSSMPCISAVYMASCLCSHIRVQLPLVSAEMLWR